jgi:MFS family permease
MLHSLLDFISSTAYYAWLSFALRFAQGIGLGLIDVAAFAALVVLYPRTVATVTAVGESILQGAFASGPFLGSLLYAAGGYKLAFFVPGVVIFLFALPECLIPQLTSRVEVAGRETLSRLLDPWLLFPIWHLTMTQIVNTYHLPVLSPYVEEALGASVMWTGTALMLGTGCVCFAAPLLGYLMDRFNPYCFFLASALLLPIVYLFLGPVPLLTFVDPSKPQVGQFYQGFIKIAPSQS